MLGVFGDPAVTGKSILDDLREGKPTVMMALARGSADRDQARRLKDLFGNPDLDPDGAAELRAHHRRHRRPGPDRTDDQGTDGRRAGALGDAPVSEEAFVELTALAAEAVDRPTLNFSQDCRKFVGGRRKV